MSPKIDRLEKVVHKTKMQWEKGFGNYAYFDALIKSFQPECLVQIASILDDKVLGAVELPSLPTTTAKTSEAARCRSR